MKETTKAYAAGIMDAEGCFTITARPRKNNVNYQKHIVLTSSSLHLMKYFVEFFGGVYSSRVSSNSNIYYQWHLSGKQAPREFLLNVIPYLTIKKAQAELLLNYLDLEGQCPDKRGEFYQQLQQIRTLESVTTDTLDCSNEKTLHAYLAGILDGEGYITISRGYYENHFKYYPQISVTNTSKFLINLLHQTYAGRVRDKIMGVRMVKPSFEWIITKHTLIESCLLKTLPYLQIRQEEAKILLNTVRLTGFNTEKRDALFNQIQKVRAEQKIKSELA